MLDGPASFLLVFGLFGVAVVGALDLFACLVAFCIPKYRPGALRSLTYGGTGGVMVFVAISAVVFVAVNEPDRSWALFAEWGVAEFLAGFAAGTFIYAVIRGVAPRASSTRRRQRCVGVESRSDPRLVCGRRPGGCPT